MNIDYEKLRKDLIDYFTSAMFTISNIALIDLERVEQASNEELEQIALQNKFVLKKYIRR